MSLLKTNSGYYGEAEEKLSVGLFSYSQTQGAHYFPCNLLKVNLQFYLFTLVGLPRILSHQGESTTNQEVPPVPPSAPLHF